MKITKSNLTSASTQWATRPSDERFWTVADLASATKEIHDARQVATTSYDNLKVTYDDKHGLRMHADKVPSAAFSNWGFRQLSEKLGCPSGFLQELRPSTVATIMNERMAGLAERERTARVSVRMDQAIPHVECFTSGKYGYIPNFKIAEGLEQLAKFGWRVAPARPAPGEKGKNTRRATKADILQNSKIGWDGNIKVGDVIGPAGLYAGDRDMFAFLISEGKPVDDGSGKHGLNRGIFVRNSEVGAAAFELTTFLYDGVCGNHIVWGADDIHKISVRHIGDAQPRAFIAMNRDLETYMLKDASELTKKMKAARKMILGKDKKETTATLFNHRSLKIGLRDLEEAFDLAASLDGDRLNPASLWGMVAGVTRLSQQAQYTNRRTRMDGAAARLMALAN